MTSPLLRFWNLVEQGPGCWNWKVSRSKGAYPHFWVNGHAQPAHRFSYEMLYGLIPEGLLVLHKCDNVKCVRPDHLFLGTQQDNVRDAIRKNRYGPRRPTIKRLHQD